MDKSHPYVIWAQKVIENYVKDKKRINLMTHFPKKYLLKRGCFVSLFTKKDGQLRGCIGTIFPIYKNLIEEIQENAIAAATRDPRFPQLVHQARRFGYFS